jgi:hypothetical protein
VVSRKLALSGVERESALVPLRISDSPHEWNLELFGFPPIRQKKANGWGTEGYSQTENALFLEVATGLFGDKR